MILFGIRSPVVVEYEETCLRLARAITLRVSVTGSPRCISRDLIVDLSELPASFSDNTFVACAFSPKRRAYLMDQALGLGLNPAPALIDPHAVVAESADVGSASFLNAGAIVGAMTKIGTSALINRTASIGHHCVLDECVSVGPGATLAGNVRVGDRAMIGAGAVVLPDIRIGADAVIAAGSLVRDHVADRTFVAGNPAKPRPFDWAQSSLMIEDGE